MKRQQLANGLLLMLTFTASLLFGLELALPKDADWVSEVEDEADEDDGACKSRIKTRDSETASLGAVVCDSKWKGQHYF